LTYTSRSKTILSSGYISTLRAYGKTISYEDAAYLIFLCGSLMNGLNNEINKIAVYAKGNRVTRPT
jgi:hypothetical protein